jgi:hypothetical protein
MLLPLNKIFKKNKDNPWQMIDDETIIIDPQLQSSFELNEVGSQIWQRIDGKSEVSKIAMDLAQIYEISEEVLNIDLTEFFSELSKQNLISEVSDVL